MNVRFLKDWAISDGFTPKQYKEGEVYDLSGLALDFVLHNNVAVPFQEPSETKVSYPSKTKVTKPTRSK
jgi:hypothetical protein